MNHQKARKKILKAADNTPHLPLEKGHFYVWIPDWHLGAWNKADDAKKNAELILKLVLWYIEALAKFIVGGDWCDLVEVRKAKRIFNQPFWRLVILHVLNHLAIYIAGNHDPLRKMVKHLRKLGLYEEKVVEAAWIGTRILLFHGYQFDWANKGGVIAKVVGWLVRYLWVFLQRYGARLSPRTNGKLSSQIKDHEIKLAKDLDIVVVTGHRHMPEMLLLGGKAVYIDGGSATRKNGVTVVEITKEKIDLVFWNARTGERTVLQTYHLNPTITVLEGEVSVGP